MARIESKRKGKNKKKVKSKKKVTRTLKFTETFNDRGEYNGGGIRNSTWHIEDEVWVEIFDDPIMDDDDENEIFSGRPQIHIGGTRRAFDELGVFFLALANYRPEQAGYHEHFDLEDVAGDPALHLIVHLPQEVDTPRTNFQVSHGNLSMVISKNGQIWVKNLKKPDKNNKTKLD